MKLVGERRALAAIVFMFYCLAYVLLAMVGPPEMQRALFALGGVYGLAFFALVAGYFWARWYAVGVGLYGVITSAVGMWQLGPEPVLLVIGGAHLAATLMLWGGSMSANYDGQTAWRQRFHMDDNAVQRLGRSVIRAGVSLPLVLAYALAPKPGGAAIVGIGALLLAGVGLRALIKMKTWGILALGAAGTMMLVLAGEGGGLAPALSGALLISATAPFAAPMLRYVRFASI